jgi:hypothetical protein
MLTGAQSEGVQGRKDESLPTSPITDSIHS